jgi:hypothetical protein
MKKLIHWTFTCVAVLAMQAGFAQETKELKEPCFNAETVIQSEVEGFVPQIMTEDCEKGGLIAYLGVKTETGDVLKIHLGPHKKVANMANSLLGVRVTIRAIQAEGTEKLIAQRVYSDTGMLVFRDEQYVPVWFNQKERKKVVQ